MGLLEVRIGFDLLKPHFSHKFSDVILPKGEHVQVIFRVVRELIPEPGQAFVHVFRLGTDVVPAVVIDVFRRESVIQDAVVIPLIQDQHPVVVQNRIKFSKGFPAVLFGKQMRQRVPQADDGVILGVNVSAQPPPVSMEGLHDKTGPFGVFKGLGQHFRAAVRTGHVESGFQEPNRVESRAGCHVQDPLDPTFLENIDEKVPFAGGPGIPVNEFIPFQDKTVDVFSFILVGFALGNGIITVQLFVAHVAPPRL